jgi:hypothetical protein
MAKGTLRWRLAPAIVLMLLEAACAGGTGGAGATGVSPALTVGGPSGGATGRLVTTGRLSVPRADQTATLLPNGDVLIAGGMARNGAFYSSAEIYHPASNSFTPTGSMSSERVGQRAILLGTGKVLITGGWGGGGVLSSAELYDPATGRFSATGSMLTKRDGQVVALLSDGRVLVASGYDGHTYVTSAEIYDPGTGEFSTTGSLQTPVSGPAITLKTGKVLISGGATDIGGAYTAFAEAELYDPASGKFAQTGRMTQPREKHSATLMADGRVLITGGNASSAWQGLYSSSEIYDPARGTFAASGGMDAARFKHGDSVALLSDGRVLVGGGADHPETYDPATNAFIRVNGRYDEARYFMTATALRNGQALIVGGYNRGIEATTAAWIYQP